MLSASAPGKLVILGEYAVLEGTPALVQAVDRYAQVSLSPSISGRDEICAKPLLEEALAFRFDNEGRFHWLDESSHQRLPFVQPLMNDLGPWGTQAGPVRLTLDTSAFFADYQGERRKLGLGSSAALAVALAAAWYASRHGVQKLDRERWLPTLVDLHRKLQNGRGSGVDVAASLYGGLVEYNTDADGQGTVQARALKAPQDVEWMWIWLGQSASTRDFLAGMEIYRRNRGEEYQAHLQTMDDIARAGLAAVQHADSDGLLSSIQAYGQAMQALGDAAQVPIYTDGHRRLAELARRFNVAFKPSGAGGGDIAFAASRDTEALSALARRVRTAGYAVVALGPAHHGLSIGSGPG